MVEVETVRENALAVLVEEEEIYRERSHIERGELTLLTMVMVILMVSIYRVRICQQ